MSPYNNVKAWLWRWLPALVMMTLIFLASSRTKSQLPNFGRWDLLGKKGGHALGYALLGAAYLWGLAAGRRPGWRLAVLALAGAALYAVTDEFHQRFVSGRTSSPVDVLIDTCGAAAGLAAWAFIQTRARSAWPRRPSTPR
jgi:hypothetical protein